MAITLPTFQTLQSRNGLAAYGDTLLQVNAFLRRNIKKPEFRWVRNHLAFCAAHGCLFLSTRPVEGARGTAGKIAGVGIAFPVTEFDPDSMPTDMDPESTKLYGAFIQVGRKYIGSGGMDIFKELLQAATQAFPHCTEFAYSRSGLRGDKRLRKMVIPR